MCKIIYLYTFIYKISVWFFSLKSSRVIFVVSPFNLYILYFIHMYSYLYSFRFDFIYFYFLNNFRLNMIFLSIFCCLLVLFLLSIKKLLRIWKKKYWLSFMFNKKSTAIKKKSKENVHHEFLHAIDMCMSMVQGIVAM